MSVFVTYCLVISNTRVDGIASSWSRIILLFLPRLMPSDLRIRRRLMVLYLLIVMIHSLLRIVQSIVMCNHFPVRVAQMMNGSLSINWQRRGSSVTTLYLFMRSSRILITSRQLRISLVSVGSTKHLITGAEHKLTRPTKRFHW